MTSSLPTAQDCQAAVDSRFLVRLPDGSGQVEMTLSEVTVWGQPFAAGGRQPFTLVFRGPVEPALPQGVYAFDGEGFSLPELFIVPIGPDPAGGRYEAVFS